MFLDLIPIDDFDVFQQKMRMKKFLHKLKPIISSRYLLPSDPSRWADQKPFSPIKPDDLPLDKYLEKKKMKERSE